MNFVFLMTDTQNQSMVGAYGNPRVDTPNLDRLASEGVRFERAYTACPLCTPARGAIFSGLHPQSNGAWMNNVAPAANIALMGEIFRRGGYRAAYTGKWHLDGSAYFGDGTPGGGFEGEWWYDGKRYAEDIGPERFSAYRRCQTSDDLRAAGFGEENLWAHRVADRARDFLERVGDEPFVLVASFDEPHGPYVAPPEYWEKFDGSEIPKRDNFFAPLRDKPRIHAVQRGERAEMDWDGFASSPFARRWYGCNSYVDREIGRVLDAVDRLHGDDTMVIYTTDHGDQFGSHGLMGKGPMMYEETCNVPLLVRLPGGPRGAVSDALASHVDLLPTLLDYAGVDRPPVLQGTSMRPALEDPACGRVREAAMVNFHRFAVNHDDWGEFFPVRCATDGRYKLVLNLFDTDELYDLTTDPYELDNRLHDPSLRPQRDGLHDWLLAEMDRIRDPFRSYQWGAREWRTVREIFYHGGARRNRPAGFPWQPTSVEAD